MKAKRRPSEPPQRRTGAIPETTTEPAPKILWRHGTPRWQVAALAAIFLALRPVVAAACPVCFSAAGEQVRQAYYLTAAFMTLLPFFVIATIALWLRKRGREPAG